MDRQISLAFIIKGNRNGFPMKYFQLWICGAGDMATSFNDFSSVSTGLSASPSGVTFWNTTSQFDHQCLISIKHLSWVESSPFFFSIYDDSNSGYLISVSYCCHCYLISAELLSVSWFETALSASVSVDAFAVAVTPYLSAFLPKYSTISTLPMEEKIAKPVYRKVYRTYILKYH